MPMKKTDQPHEEKCRCGGEYWFSKYCGAWVCDTCNDHKGLARCYCGWGLGQNEHLEDDIGYATYNDQDGWDVDY